MLVVCGSIALICWIRGVSNNDHEPCLLREFAFGIMKETQCRPIVEQGWMLAEDFERYLQRQRRQTIDPLQSGQEVVRNRGKLKRIIWVLVEFQSVAAPMVLVTFPAFHILRMNTCKA